MFANIQLLEAKIYFWNAERLIIEQKELKKLTPMVFPEQDALFI